MARTNKNPARGLERIVLPKPALTGAGSLGRALKARRTIRESSDKRLPGQVLSNLLWAACGVNRKHGPFGLVGRTAASASNSQEVDVYVALKEGAYRYDPLDHALLPVAAGDLRRLAIGRGQRRTGDKAPARLVYVADIDKLVNSAGFQEPGLHDPDVQRSYYFVDTGLIAGNVYLYAASAGLATWFHNCDRKALQSRLQLGRAQRALFGQTVGYPSDKSQ